MDNLIRAPSLLPGLLVIPQNDQPASIAYSLALEQYHSAMRLKLDEAAIAWREVDNDVVALDLRTSQYLTLNSVGRVLWMRLAEGATETDLIRLIVEDAGVDPQIAEQDVRAFIKELRDRGLLVAT